MATYEPFHASDLSMNTLLPTDISFSVPLIYPDIISNNTDNNFTCVLLIDNTVSDPSFI